MLQYLNSRIEKSRAIISQMLSLCQNPYLALSFGKDSIVMMDLVREQKPDIQCLFLKSEESFLMHNYEEMIDHYRNLGAVIDIVEMTHLDHDFEHGANNEFQQDRFFDGWDGVFMGLRIEESKARRITIVKKSHNEIGSRIMQYKTGRRSCMYRACPVADWSGFEVFLYAKEKGLRLLDCYTDESVRTSAQLPYSQGLTSTLHRVLLTDYSRYNLLVSRIPKLTIYG